MSDVLVCAEPETREEANQFVSKLGARPQIWSMRALKKRHEKVKGVLVYLKGTEPPATLRSCLRQVSKDSPLHVVVFSHPSSDHQAAELGKIVGELRPRRTYICFDSEEVQKVFHVQMRVVAGDQGRYAFLGNSDALYTAVAAATSRPFLRRERKVARRRHLVSRALR